MAISSVNTNVNVSGMTDAASLNLDKQAESGLVIVVSRYDHHGIML